jgi:hypothetical protein
VAAWNRPRAQAQVRTGTCRWKASRLLEAVDLDGLADKRGLVRGGVGFTISIVLYDKRRLLVTLPGLSWPNKPAQVVVLMPPLYGAVVWPKLVDTASTVLPPRAEDAGNGYSALS